MEGRGEGYVERGFANKFQNFPLEFGPLPGAFLANSADGLEDGQCACLDGAGRPRLGLRGITTRLSFMVMLLSGGATDNGAASTPRRCTKLRRGERRSGCERRDRRAGARRFQFRYGVGKELGGNPNPKWGGSFPPPPPSHLVDGDLKNLRNFLEGASPAPRDLRRHWLQLACTRRSLQSFRRQFPEAVLVDAREFAEVPEAPF